MAPDQSKTAKITTWPVPTSAKGVQQFLGIASYYRQFIRDFAKIAKPLHRLTERTTKFVWNSECQTAFEELRRRLSQTPILAHPDFNRQFILDTDASDVGIGAVLSQVGDDGHERVIAYGSRLLTKAERQYCVTRKELLSVVTFTRQYRSYLLGRRFERQYCVTRKELLSVVTFTRQYRSYLLGRRFVLRTDHGSLKWLRNFREPEGQLARWLERLQEFDFEVVHRPGKKHTNADALSRVPCNQCGQESHENNCSINATTLQASLSPLSGLRAAQLADPVLGPLLQGKESGSKPNPEELGSASRHTRRLLQIWDQLEVHKGVLCRLFLPNTSDQQSRIQQVIPRSLQEEVLNSLHEGVMGGHLGIEKTLGRLKERFYWPGHHLDVSNWCRNCSTCSVRKAPAHTPRAPLRSIKAGYPLQIVAMDIMGPFPESTAGNSFILVISDYFTRWVEAFGIPNQAATTVASKITEQFFFRFGLPEQLHSDQGRNFESEVVSEVCKILGIAKTRTTPYHPQSDGLVERLNKTLLNMLAMATSEYPSQWNSHLRNLCMAYNTSVQPTTGFSPFYLMFGRQARVPIDIMYGTPTPPMTPVTEYAACLKQRLENAYEQVRGKMGHSLDRQKDLYDKRIHGKPLATGDKVWLHCPAVPRGKSKKLHCPWKGPFRIIRKFSDVTYQIQNVRSRRQRMVVHFNRLKYCPENVRESPHQQPEVTSSSANQPLPPGTNLQLIDYDESENENVRPSEEQVNRRGPPTSNTQLQVSHNYPRRNRRPPDYHDHV